MHQERLLDAAHFIENNLFEDIRAADIASQICLSERSLQLRPALPSPATLI